MEKSDETYAKALKNCLRVTSKGGAKN